jgi:hypothetical protein
MNRTHVNHMPSPRPAFGPDERRSLQGSQRVPADRRDAAAALFIRPEGKRFALPEAEPTAPRSILRGAMTQMRSPHATDSPRRDWPGSLHTGR